MSASRVIDAEPQVLFDIVADPRMHPAIDGGETVRGSWKSAPDRLSQGAKFSMSMRLFGVPYVIRNTVTEFEEGRRIAWKHLFGHTWRWEFAPAPDGGTTVTETFDWGTSWAPEAYFRKAGFLDRNEVGIEASLARLAEVAATRTAG